MNLKGTFLGNAKATSRMLAGRTVPSWLAWETVRGRPLPQPKSIDLVLEGYPRSGNTFAEHMLRIMCPGLRWISHTHSAGTLLWAKKHHIPCLLLIREPLDAAISLFIYRMQSVSLELCLKEWAAFHLAAESLPQTHVIPFQELVEATEQSLTSSLKNIGLAHFIKSSLPSNPRDSFEASHDHDKWHLKEVRGVALGEEQGNKPSPQRQNLKLRIMASLESLESDCLKTLIIECKQRFEKYEVR